MDWMAGLRPDAGQFFLLLAAIVAAVFANTGVGMLIGAAVTRLFGNL